jgi:hypothetical protein
MACTEVFGGFGASDRAIRMHGLNAWVLARPYQRADAGGDIHLVSSCGTGRISRLLLADISGHGVKVAPIASQLRTLMRRYVNHVEHRAFLESLNRDFTGLASAGVFATAVAVSYFAPTGALSVTLAGHPRPLIYNRRLARWREMPVPHTPEPPRSATSAQNSSTPPSLPLGIFEDTPYPAIDFKTSPGDLCLLYSDSLPEAMRADGTLLGTSGLLALIAQLDADQPEKLASTLYQRVRDWAGTPELGDDVSILVVQAAGLSAGAPLGERLGAGLKFLGSVAAWPFGGPRPAFPEISRANILGSLVPRAARHVGAAAPEV